MSVATVDASIMGAAILGVKESLISPSILREFSRLAELEQVTPSGFYPLSLYLELVDYLSARLNKAVVLKMGRRVGQNIIETSLSKLSIANAAEAIQAIDAAHEQFCSPKLGSFEVVDKSENALTVVNTTPYECVLQEGLFSAVAEQYGRRPAVEHVACRHNGAPACRYRIEFR